MSEARTAPSPLADDALCALVKYDLKILARAASDFELDELIPIFHRWIRHGFLDELLIDVADYSHVPDGPGVLLIGHDAQYSVDLADGRPGLLYSRRRETSDRITSEDIDTTGERLLSVIRTAFTACRELQGQNGAAGKLTFDGDELHLYVNDRLCSATSDSEVAVLCKELEAVVDQLYGQGCATVDRIAGDPRERLGFRIAAPGAPGVDTLLNRLDNAD